MVTALELRKAQSRAAAFLGTILVIGAIGLGGCTYQSPIPGKAALRQPSPEPNQGVPEKSAAADFQIVECELPRQIRRLGLGLVYLGPQHLVRTTARDCVVRGGDLIRV